MKLNRNIIGNLYKIGKAEADLCTLLEGDGNIGQQIAAVQLMDIPAPMKTKTPICAQYFSPRSTPKILMFAKTP